MSEWAPCYLCGAERENLCACLNPQCSDYVALAIPAKQASAAGMKPEQKAAVETLHSAVSRCTISGVCRDDNVTIDYDTAIALRGLIDDLDTAAQALPLAEGAYKQADERLKEAIVAIEAMRQILRDVTDTMAYLIPHLAVGGDCRPKVAEIITRIAPHISPSAKPSTTS